MLSIRRLQGPQPAAAGEAVDKEGTDEDKALDMADWLQRSEAKWTSDEQLLAHGAAIIAEKRAAVLAELQFSVSAGVVLVRWMSRPSSIPFGACGACDVSPRDALLLPAIDAPCSCPSAGVQQAM
jgi:hypothetical protein